MTIDSPLSFTVLLHPDNLKRFSVARIIPSIIHGDVASRIPVLEVGSHRDWVANVSSYIMMFLGLAIFGRSISTTLALSIRMGLLVWRID